MSGCKTPTNGALWNTIGICALSASLAAGLARTAASQTEYYNLDSNRPLRVEDAVPTERRALDVQFAPLRLEAFAGGARRWRVDPKLSYGVASLTEIEIRLPILLVQQGADAPTMLGLTSIGIGGMRAINTETALFPALAISAEVLVPAGLLAPPKTSYAVKGLLTKTFALARLSVNASYGTFSVVPPAASSPACRLLPPGAPGCNGQPTVPDVPCTRGPAATSPELSRPGRADAIGASFAAACLTSDAPAAPPVDASRSLGNRWFGGAAIDHTFPLSSTLLGADVFAERLIGLSPLVDWTAEVGVRHQWSPQVVLDAGVSRHFAGSLRSTAMTVGATYVVAAGRP